jgi:hypothetical protein
MWHAYFDTLDRAGKPGASTPRSIGLDRAAAWTRCGQGWMIVVMYRSGTHAPLAPLTATACRAVLPGPD